jgi:hypothetical protein
MSAQNKNPGFGCSDEGFAPLTISHSTKRQIAAVNPVKKLTEEDAGWVSVEKDDLKTKDGKTNGMYTLTVLSRQND